MIYRMKEPNFTETYKIYRYIATSIFGRSASPDFVVTSEVMNNGKTRYQLKFQGCVILSTYVATEIFAYLYMKDIPKEDVILNI